MTPTEIKELIKKYDVQIGSNIRVMRKAKGLSQGALSDTLGITFQQVQKYESGSNRVSGGRLIMIAHAIGRLPSDILNIDWTDGKLMEAEGKAAKDLKELIELRKMKSAVCKAVEGDTEDETN